jgi:Holliday junction resolvase RusA-like endonuclease
VDFALSYIGKLPSRQQRVSEEKDQLREAFAPQIQELLQNYVMPSDEEYHQVAVGDVQYSALIVKKLNIGVHLDIQMLTPSKRRRPGDVDNRIKTLIDGLTVPRPGVKTTFGSGGSSRACLLEDDSLVLRYNLDSRQWLGRGHEVSETLVVIGVRVVNAGLPTYAGMRLSV